MSKARAVVRRVAWAALGFGVLFTALLRRPAANTVDPTDLVALVMLAVALGDARRLLHAQ